MKLKSALLVSLLFLLTINTSFSQKRMSITYKDGKVVSGFGKITGKGVKFKTTKKGKYTKISSDLIDKGVMTSGKKNTAFAFKSLKKGKRAKLFELIYDGENISLYKWVSGGFKTSAGSVGIKAKVIRYYVARKTEEIPTMLRSGSVFGKSFEKRAKEYFKDCSLLTSKLGTKNFKKDDIDKVIEFYDKNCMN